MPAGFVYQMTFSLNLIYSEIYRRYDLINRLFTFGMDRKWRKYTAIQCVQEKPARVLDLCCGTGDMAIAVALLSSQKTDITGYDANKHMIEIALRKSQKKGFSSIEYILGDVISIPFPENNFDCITVGFGFRNLTYRNPHRDKYLSEIFRVLKRNGKIFILESGIPQNRIIKYLFKAYLYLVLIPVGFIVSGSGRAYRYLAQSSAGFYTEDEIKQLLTRAGFQISFTRRFFFGAAGLTVAYKP